MTQAPFGAGTAVDFNGSGQSYISIANNAAYQLANGSVQFWFNASSTDSQQTLFAKDSGLGSVNGLTIGLDGNRVVAQIGSGGDDVSDGGSITSSLGISAGTWHQVTLSFGTGGMQLYLDGQLVGSSAFAGGLVGNAAPISLGLDLGDAEGGGNGWWGWGEKTRGGFNGLIDQVAIFGSALTQGQVQQTIVDGSAKVGPGPAGAGLSGGLGGYTYAYVNGALQITDTRPLDPQAVGYWSFNQITNRSVADVSGTAGAGTFAAPAGSVLSGTGPGATQAPFGAGAAANFNGRDYLTIPDSQSLQLSQGAVQFWFDASSTNGQQTLFSKGGLTDGQSVSVSLVGNKLLAQFGQGWGAVTLVGDQTISAKSWYQAAVSFGANGAELYLNGALVAETLDGVRLVGNHDPIVLGASMSGPFVSSPFTGLIDELAIFNVPLTRTQVNALMTQGAPALIAQFAAAGAIDGVETITGVEHLTFADGAVGYVLGAGSNNIPILTEAEVQSLGAGGQLVVFGDGSETLTLAGSWTSGPTQTVGGAPFRVYNDGPASLLVMPGVLVTVDPNLVIPTIVNGTPVKNQPGQAALTTQSTGAVAFEPVDPTKLLSLIQTSSIKISSAMLSQPGPSLVFDEATGMLEEMVPSASGVGASLVVDGLGEEWLFVSSATTSPLANPEPSEGAYNGRWDGYCL